MTPTLKPYPAYKDSGVAWLGQVPELWEVRRLKTAVDHINEQTSTKTDEDLYIALEHVESWTGRLLLPTGEAQFDSQGKRFRAGDVLFGKLRPYLAKVVRPQKNGVCVGEFFVLRARSVVAPHYLEVVLRSAPAIDFVNSSTFGAKMPRADWTFVGAMLFPLPPLPEQTAIVRFLDYMDRRIRRVVHARQRQIKLLEEYRQALIHQAVTGQIDVRTGKPYPAYKDSGVPWLGKVPEHWEVKPVKRHYDIQLGKMLQTRPNSPDDIEVPYLKAQHVQWFSVRTLDAPRMWASPREIQQFGITAGDLLVCEGGEGGRCGIVKEIPEGFIIQNALHRVRPRNHCRNDYLQYVMSVISATGWFEALNNKATIAHFTREKFGALNIPTPSVDEQTAIVDYLDAQTAKIEAAIAAARREIDLVREYRERLIADVVTGKVDVREVAAQLPEEPEHESDIIDIEIQDVNDDEILDIVSRFRESRNMIQSSVSESVLGSGKREGSC
jgi:type I restriction enzyme S subunit